MKLSSFSLGTALAFSLAPLPLLAESGSPSSPQPRSAAIVQNVQGPTATGRVFYDIDAVRRAMKTPYPGLVILTSHRGEWRNEAENTTYALQLALEEGLESLEIDVRLDYAGVPWLIHDFALDRISTGTGYLSMNQSPDIDNYLIKYRDGTISGRRFQKFANVLDWFASGLSIYDDDGSTIVGSFLLVDLKSPPKNDLNITNVSGYKALQASWDTLVAISKQYPRLNTPGGGINGLGRAVAFKIKGRELPSDPAQLERDLGLKGDGTDNFYLVPVLHADDSAAGNGVMSNYLNKPYVLTVEPNMEFLGQPNASTWVKALQDRNMTVPGFPGWNEYPEGVAFASGFCCLDRSVDPTKVDSNLDYSGVYVYSLASGSNWLTADTASDLISILGQRGLRNIDPMLPQPPNTPVKKGEKR